MIYGENKKVRIIEVPGKSSHMLTTQPHATVSTYHSALVDEDYLLVGTHIDENTKQKVVNGEYVDFAKLLPSDRLVEDDHRMEMVNKGGLLYWVPVVDHETTALVTTENGNKHLEYLAIFIPPSTPTGLAN